MGNNVMIIPAGSIKLDATPDASQEGVGSIPRGTLIPAGSIELDPAPGRTNIKNNKPLTKPSGIVERALIDPLVGLARGAFVETPAAVIGLADIPTMGKVGKAIDEAAKSMGLPTQEEARGLFNQMLTQETQDALRKVSEAKGFIPTAKTAVENPSSIVQMVVENLAPMKAGAMAGVKVLKAVGKPIVSTIAGKEAVDIGRAAVAGGIGEGITTAGQNIEQTRLQTEGKELTPKQVALTATSAGVTGLIGVLGGKLAEKLKIPDINTLLAGGVGAADKKAILRSLALGAIKEGTIEELPQSAQEQIAQNISLNRPWDEGVAEAAATGWLVGMAQGAGASAVSGAFAAAKPIAGEPTDILKAVETPEKVIAPQTIEETPVTQSPEEIKANVDKSLKDLDNAYNYILEFQRPRTKEEADNLATWYEAQKKAISNLKTEEPTKLSEEDKTSINQWSSQRLNELSSFETVRPLTVEESMEKDFLQQNLNLPESIAAGTNILEAIRTQKDNEEIRINSVKRSEEISNRLETEWFRGEDQTNISGDKFFSASKDIAGNFGKVSQINKTEIPKNPLVINSKEDLAPQIGYKYDPMAEPAGLPAEERFDSLAKNYARENGYDGIIYVNGTLGERELHSFPREEEKVRPVMENIFSRLQTRVPDLEKLNALKTRITTGNPIEKEQAAGVLNELIRTNIDLFPEFTKTVKGKAPFKRVSPVKKEQLKKFGLTEKDVSVLSDADFSKFFRAIERQETVVVPEELQGMYNKFEKLFNNIIGLGIGSEYIDVPLRKIIDIGTKEGIDFLKSQGVEDVREYCKQSGSNYEEMIKNGNTEIVIEIAGVYLDATVENEGRKAAYAFKSEYPTSILHEGLHGYFRSVGLAGWFGTEEEVALFLEEKIAAKDFETKKEFEIWLEEQKKAFNQQSYQKAGATEERGIGLKIGRPFKERAPPGELLNAIKVRDTIWTAKIGEETDALHTKFMELQLQNPGIARLGYVDDKGKFLDRYLDKEKIGKYKEENKISYKTGKVVLSKGVPDAFKDKTVTLTHYSNTEGLKVLDPKMYGTAVSKTATISERTRAMAKDFIPMTFFGVKGYEREWLLGKKTYTAKIDGNIIYDAEKDAFNLTPSFKELYQMGLGTNDADNVFAKRVLRKGYEGIYYDKYKVVKKFSPTEVIPTAYKKMAYKIGGGRSLGAQILSGEKEVPNVKPYISDVATYLNKMSAKYASIDHRTATPEQNRIVEEHLLEFFFTSLGKYPEALEWYRKDMEKTMSILTAIHPSLKQKEDNFIFKIILAITSDGMQTTDNIIMAERVYRHWKKNKNFDVSSVIARRGDFSKNLVFADKLLKSFKNYSEAEKWLLGRDTRENIEKDLSSRGLTRTITGELKDANVVRSLAFGAKVGAFFANLSGDFSPITMDMWFMRTIGRIQGNLIEGGTKEEADAQRERLRSAIKNSPQGMKLVNISPSLFGESNEYVDEISKEISKLSSNEDFRKKIDALPGGEELRRAANYREKFLRGAMPIDSPQGGAHREWLRDRFSGIKKILDDEGHNFEYSDIQAVIWIGEKGLYEKFGIKGREGKYFSEGAEDLYKRLYGRPFGRNAGATRRILERPEERTLFRIGKAEIQEESRLAGVEGIIPQIYKTAVENPEGFTIDISTGGKIAEGFAVAPAKETEAIFDTLTEDTVYDYIISNKELFDYDERAFFGGWKNEDPGSKNFGKFILDISFVVDNLETAIYLAEFGEQDGIFNIGEQEYIPTGEGVKSLKERGLYDTGKRAEYRRIRPEMRSILERSRPYPTQKIGRAVSVLKPVEEPKIQVKLKPKQEKRQEAPDTEKTPLTARKLADRLGVPEEDVQAVFKTISNAEEIEKAGALLTDRSRTIDYILQNKNLPKGYREMPFVVAAASQAVETGDAELINALFSQGSIIELTSWHAQELQVLREIYKNSAVGAIADVKKTKMDVAEKKDKNIKTKIKEETENNKKEYSNFQRKLSPETKELHRILDLLEC